MEQLQGYIPYIITALAALYAIAIYNKLVALRNRVKNSFAQIDVQLVRRYDLIPNIVETAKKYMSHEKETLEAIVQARTSAMGAESAAKASPENPEAMAKLSGAEQQLGSSLGKFFALMENYPDLKANQTMAQTMEELSSTENKVAFARQAFNDAVMFFNTYRQSFPQVVFAAVFGFQEAAEFSADSEEQRKAVKVSW